MHAGFSHIRSSEYKFFNEYFSAIEDLGPDEYNSMP